MNRRYIKIVASIVLVLLCLGTGMASFLSSKAFTEELGRNISDIATDAMQSRISIGEVAVEGYNTVGLKNVAVCDKNGDTIAVAEYANIKVSPLSFLENNPLDAVNEINLGEVSATIVQREDGSFNFQDLISEEKAGNYYHGKINVNNSKATIKFNGNEINFEDINGKLDFKSYPDIHIDATALEQGAEIDITGMVGGEKQTISLEGKDIALENYIKYIPEGKIPGHIENITGNVDKIKANLIKIGSDVYYTGELSLSNGKADIYDTKVENIKGLIVLDERKALVRLNASAAEQEAYAHGKIILNDGTPIFDVNIEAKDFEPNKIFTKIDYTGPATLNAHLTGPVSNPQVDGELSAKNGVVAGYDFANLSAKVSYLDSKVYAKDIVIDALGGQITGEAEFNAKDNSYVSHVKVERIDLTKFSAYVPDIESGSLEGDIGIDGKGADLDALNIYGSLNAQDVEYKWVSAKEMHTSFKLSQRNMLIDFLSVELKQGGRFGIGGTINPNSLDLRFYGKNTDMARLANLLPDTSMAGRLDFQGSIKGDLKNPVVDIDMKAFGGNICSIPFDTISGQVAGSLRGLEISNFIMEYGDYAKWYIHGKMGYRDEQGSIFERDIRDMGINLTVETVGARIENILKATKIDKPLTGNIDNIITITGDLRKPNIVGYVHFYQGSYDGIIIDGMDGDYFVNDNTVRLQVFHVFSPWFDAVLNGRIVDMEKFEDMKISIDVFNPEDEKKHLLEGLKPDLKEILTKAIAEEEKYEKETKGTIVDRLEEVFNGRAHFDGVFSGTLHNPIFNGEFSSQDLSVFDVPISSVSGDINYNNYIVTAHNLGFSQNNGSCLIDAVYNINTKNIKGELGINNMDVASILGMLNIKNDKISGALVGKVSVLGSLANPQITAKLEMNQGSISGYNVHDVVLDGVYSDKVMIINECRGYEGETGKFLAEGSAQINGELKGVVSLTDVELGVFTGLANIDAPVHGKVSGEFQAHNQLSNPYVDGSISITNPSLKKVKLDSINGILQLRDNVINIEQLTLNKAIKKLNSDNQMLPVNYQAVVKGLIPIKALSSNEATARSSSMDVNISLDNAELSILPVVSDLIEWATGEIDGNLRITGNRYEPLMDGKISSTDVAIKLKAMELPILDMSNLISFSGNTITLEQASGKIGNGQYDIKGFLKFKGTSIDDYKLDLNADKLDIACEFYRGPFTMNMSVNKGEVFGYTMPKIKGNVDVNDAIISIPSLSDDMTEYPRFFMDVDLNIGDKVYFFVPNLADLQFNKSSVHIGGTMKHPKTSGKISVKRGNISYLKTVFKVREAALEFGQPVSMFPSIRLKADTKINKTHIYVTIDGMLYDVNRDSLLQFTSVPEMSQDEIIKMLTLKTTYGANGKENIDMTGSAFNLGMQMTILGELETSMRNALGLDLFSVYYGSWYDNLYQNDNIEKNRTNENEYIVEIGKYFNDNIMARYKMSIGGNHEYRYYLDYEFENNIELSISRDNDERTIFSTEAKIPFYTFGLTKSEAERKYDKEKEKNIYDNDGNIIGVDTRTEISFPKLVKR